MRETWSDDRLDVLNHKVDDGFREVAQRFGQVDQRFAQVDQRFEQVDKRFDRLEDRFERLEYKFDRKFDSLTRTMILGNGAIVAALIGVVATRL